MQAGQRVVALDGPAGSGKSTVARALARHLGWRYVDTGASYRAATLAVLRAGADPDDAAAVLAAVSAADIALSSDPERPQVLLDGENVSDAVRGPQVTSAVSAVSAVPAVRSLMVELQRAAIGSSGAVAEGRDVGSVVTPNARLKVYLDARPEIRAARRAGDGSTGILAPSAPDVQQAVQEDLARRDAQDRSRAASPLRAAEDAVRLDTSDLTQAQVVEELIVLARGVGLA